MKVEMITHTPNPEEIVATAAKLCYSNSDIEELMNKQTPEKVEKFIKKLSEMHHESPFEHIYFTFAIEGVSRTLLAQITRHRIASFSVQSQRYVNMENFSPVIPRSIMSNDICLDKFTECITKIKETYKYISEYLSMYYEMQGIDRKDAEKKAIEDARYVLPNACPTKIMITANARSLMNFFKLRCCNRAQDEIRTLAKEMLRQCREIAPNIFAYAGPACATGKCDQGSMSCGHPQNGEDL